jgi:hypothetical protein
MISSCFLEDSNRKLTAKAACIDFLCGLKTPHEILKCNHDISLRVPIQIHNFWGDTSWCISNLFALYVLSASQFSFFGSKRQILHKTRKNGGPVWWIMSIILATRKAEEDHSARPAQDRILSPYMKTVVKAKRSWFCSRGRHLHRTCKSLSSNPGTTKRTGEWYKNRKKKLSPIFSNTSPSQSEYSILLS